MKQNEQKWKHPLHNAHRPLPVIGLLISLCLWIALSSGQALAADCTWRTEKIAAGTSYETTLYIIESDNDGPTVLISGGVHGNEPAGYQAAAKLTGQQIDCGTLLILPQANRIAVEKGLRAPSATGNLNRKFPTTAGANAEGTLAKSILSMMKKYDVDWVIDLHEGYDYAKRKTTDSVGQSVIYYPAGQAKTAAQKIVNTLNQQITTDYRQFQLLKYPAKGSLTRAAAVVCGANSMIVETCTRDTLQTRISRQLTAVGVVLDYVGMK